MIGNVDVVRPQVWHALFTLDDNRECMLFLKKKDSSQYYDKRWQVAMFMFSEAEEAHSYCYEGSLSGPHHKLVFQSKLLGIKQMEEATATEEGLLLGAAVF